MGQVWPLQIACCAQPNVQNPKNLQWYKTEGKTANPHIWDAGIRKHLVFLPDKLLPQFQYCAWFTIIVSLWFDWPTIRATVQQTSVRAGIYSLYLTGLWRHKLMPPKVISLGVICHLVPCIHTGMMTAWSCLLLKTHPRRRTWKTGWLGRWRNTQTHVRSWSADTASMSGASPGKRLRPCECLTPCSPLWSCLWLRTY